MPFFLFRNLKHSPPPPSSHCHINSLVAMADNRSQGGSDIGHEDLSDVAAFDADADVLPDTSTRREARAKQQRSSPPHRTSSGHGKSKLRNSLNYSSARSTGKKSQADELRKGALVNRASVHRNRKMSEKRQDSFMSAARILERTASDLAMVRDELKHQKKKVSMTMVKEEIVM